MDVRPKPFWTFIGCIVALPFLYILVWVTGGRTTRTPMSSTSRSFSRLLMRQLVYIGNSRSRRWARYPGWLIPRYSQYGSPADFCLGCALCYVPSSLSLDVKRHSVSPQALRNSIKKLWNFTCSMQLWELSLILQKCVNRNLQGTTLADWALRRCSLHPTGSGSTVT